MEPSDTKEALLNHAQELIQRVGVNAMSYSDLSEAVGIRKASIHYHFPKKENLIAALVQRCYGVYSEEYRKVAEADKTAKEKLTMLASIYEQGVRANKLCLFAMLSTEYASLSESIRAALKDAVEEKSKILEKVFVQGIEEGVFDRGANTYDLAYGFMGFLMGTQVISRCAQNPRAFKKAAKACIEALTR